MARKIKSKRRPQKRRDLNKFHSRAVGAVGLRGVMEAYGSLFMADRVIRKDYPDFAARMDYLSKTNSRHESLSQDEYERVLDTCLALYGTMMVRLVTAEGLAHETAESIKMLMLLVLLGAHLHEVGLLTLPQLREQKA